MGYNFASDLASMGTMSHYEQINLHLQYNFYPPVPSSMVLPCVQAIDAYFDEDYDRQIEMPLGVSYRGMDTAPAHAIIDQHRLHAWLEQDEYEGE